ncbi:type II secretion system protein GspK [Methylobacter sp.]|uniref:general secretion pathway protein GspK n=1 Tax=Methylobacter sp. TaxID=2051955 RepID=UPI001208083B|nr:type II secretion system protein GspK [Methylobacter sp.]TAK62579.1 MAG: general secretion pathway protein GspK [Methylobacter sp.]
MSRPAEGFALVLVLWVLSLLTIMAGSFALTMQREAAVVTGSRNNAQAMAIAESGLAVAELMLMNPDQQKRWRTDGSIYQIDYPDFKVRVRLFSETGKIDINSADQTLLQGFIAYAPIEDELQAKLVNAILDWRDEDDLVHIDGAEKEDYKEAGLSYRPRNKPFQSIEELQLVLGMNEQVFKWLENLVTVYSGQPTVDSTQAAKEVLRVLPGADAESIDEYIAARRISAVNGLPAPAFMSKGNGAAQPELSNQDEESAQNSAIERSYATVASDGTVQKGAITVIAEAQSSDDSMAMIKALIKRSDNPEASPFQVLKWQRNAATDDSLFTAESDQLLVRQYAEPEFNN